MINFFISTSGSIEGRALAGLIEDREGYSEGRGFVKVKGIDMNS